MSRNWAAEFELPEGRTSVINLMSAEYDTTGRELLGIISVEIFITLSPDNKISEVYKSGWDSSAKKELFSPTDVGLRKILAAGGVKEKEFYSEKIASRIWYAKYSGEYMRPDGEIIPLSQDYEFDTTVGGPRWLVKKEAENKSSVCKMVASQTNQSWVNLNDDAYIEKWLDLSDEQRDKIEKVSEFKATRFVDQIAQYGRQRAGTGAINRAIRKSFVVRSYTAEELKTCCFHITSSRVDPGLRRIGMGVLGAKVLEMSEALAGKLNDGALGEVLRLVAQNEMQQQTASQPGYGAFIDDDTIDGESFEVDPDEKRLFLTSASKETRGLVMQEMVHFYGWTIFNIQVAGNRSQGLFNKRWRELSEGEMALLLKSYQKLNQTRGDMPYKDLSSGKKAEIKQQAAHIADIIRRCAHEKRLWHEDEQAEQIELPGIMPQEEPTEVTDENEPASSTTE